MSSILKVDTIQDQSGNNIISEAANVITIGASGDTITVPAGATVSGFTSAGIDDNATSVAITINSSEQVGIGTTSFDQDAKLTIAGSGSGGSNPSSINANTVATFRRTGGTSHVANISVLSGTTGASILNLGDRDDEDIGSITYNHSDNSMAFTTNTSEKMRTTSAGDLLVGTTSANPGIGNTNTGFSVTNSGGQVGNIAISQNGNYSANFNRNTSDGTVVQISKDGTVKHVITTTALGVGTSSPQNTLHVVKNAISGVSYRTNAPLIVENNSSTEIQILSANSGDGQLRFGDDGSNFRGAITYAHADDTMSLATNGANQVKINSNGVMSVADGIALGVGLNNTASNVLDDYEEGTWTPGLDSVGSSNASGQYTKIGNVCTAKFRISSDGSGSNINITGFPFTATSATGEQQGLARETQTSGKLFFIRISAGNTVGTIIRYDASSSITSNDTFEGQVTYITNT